MACKRTATTDLNHDNWNEEELPEEPGTFTKASADVLEKRVLKTAKRRITNTGEPVKSAFSSFAGFKTAANTNAASQFSFLSNFNSSNANTTKPVSTANGSQNTAENGSNEVKSVNSSVFSKESTVKSSQETTSQKSPKKGSTYYSKLKGLNEGVSQWIKKHVDKNPYCILTPIFKDYEKYLTEIETLKPTENQQPKPFEINKSPVKTTESSTKETESSIFSNVKTNFSNTDTWKPDKQASSSVNSTVKVNFEQKKSFDNLFSSADSDSNPFFKKSNNTPSDDTVSANVDAKPTSSIFSVNAVNPATFSFGQSSTGTPSAGFSFGSSKPFTFGAQVTKPVVDSNEKTEEDDKNEDDEPPKPDFKPIVEEGSIYDQRCKVFVKKDDKYVDRGVGTLFLKPTPNDKMQLIVRAVNSLGNLLINTLLMSSMPIKRMKDNTIMIICLPMPDSEPPPTSVLFRVKTKEDGDQLFEALEKHAK